MVSNKNMEREISSSEAMVIKAVRIKLLQTQFKKFNRYQETRIA